MSETNSTLANQKLTIGRVPSEFEIQAFLYSSLLEMGLKVRGEVRCSVGQKRVRFDLLVFRDDGEAAYAIEVKPKRRMAWRAEWAKGHQCSRYGAAPIPVFMVCGQQQAEEFLTVDRLQFATARGLIWRETWLSAP